MREDKCRKVAVRGGGYIRELVLLLKSNDNLLEALRVVGPKIARRTEPVAITDESASALAMQNFFVPRLMLLLRFAEYSLDSIYVIAV